MLRGVRRRACVRQNMLRLMATGRGVASNNVIFPKENGIISILGTALVALD